MKKRLVIILAVAFVFRVIFSFLVWHPDVRNHMDWGERFWDYGPSGFYNANVWNYTWPNQPPGTIYLFAGMYKVSTAIFSVFWWININIPLFPSNIMFFLESNLYPALLHLPAILADLGIAYLIYSFFKKQKLERAGIFGSIAFLLNPVIWYNSSIWGQTESVINFFALLAFILLLEKKLIWATFALVLSFYIKASLFIFAPIFLIIALRQKYSFWKIFSAVFVPLTLIVLFTLPFSPREPVGWLFSIYKDKIFTQQLQVITANAFNLWAGVAGIHERPQTLLLGPLSYKTWGLILFSLSYIPATLLVYRKQDWKSIFWSLAVVSFASFTLLTNMHERYLYPLFPAFTILVANDLSLIPLLATVSVISLVNLYNFWWVPKVNFLVEFLSAWDRLVPRILGLAVTVMFLLFLKRFFRLLKARK